MVVNSRNLAQTGPSKTSESLAQVTGKSSSAVAWGPLAPVRLSEACSFLLAWFPSQARLPQVGGHQGPLPTVAQGCLSRSLETLLPRNPSEGLGTPPGSPVCSMWSPWALCQPVSRAASWLLWAPGTGAFVGPLLHKTYFKIYFTTALVWRQI